MDQVRKMAIHEASHAIIARLFQDYLDLQQVTICRRMLSGETEPDKIVAANSGNMKRYDPEAYMAYSITNLAGIIGQNIAAEGREAFAGRKKEILDQPDSLDKEFGGKDFQEFSNTLSVNHHRYKLDQLGYQQFCLEFLVDFLTIPEVWESVEKFADAILDKADEKMEALELASFFANSGYDNFLKSNGQEFLARILYKETGDCSDGNGINIQ